MANETALQKILNIRVNNSDALKKIVEYRTEIDRLKRNEEVLNKMRKDGTISAEKYNSRMAESKIVAKEYNDAVRVLNKEIENNIKVQQAEEGSLVALRAGLSNLTAEYDKLSDTAKNSFDGQDLEVRINAVTDKISEQEQRTQRFYRNVGNYSNAFTKVLEPMKQKLNEMRDAYMAMTKEERKSAEGKELLGKITEMQNRINGVTEAGGKFQSEIIKISGLESGFLGNMSSMVGGLSSVSAGFAAAKAAAIAFGKQLMKLLTNPIILILSAIALAIYGIVKAVKSSEDATNRISVLMAPLGRALDYVLNIMQKGIGYILSWVEEGAKLLDWVSGMLEKLPLVGDSIKENNERNREAIELAKEKIAIERQGREDEVQNAKDALAVSELRTKAKDKEKHTAEERLRFVREANKLEEQQAKRNVDLAQRKLEALQKESEWAENNAETNKELAKLEADLYNARKEYFDKTRMLKQQENQIINEEQAEEKRKAKEAADSAKERSSKEREAVRAAEDALFALVKESAEKRRQELNTSYNREIEDLKIKLANEKNLTQKAREAINETIVSLEAQRQRELDKLSNDELTREIAKEQKRIELMLSAVKSGSDQEFQLKLQQLQKQRELELANTELTEQDKQLIRDKYRFQEDKLIDEHTNAVHQKQMDAIRVDYETRIAQAYGNEVEILNLQMQQKKAELDAIQQLEGESIEAFNLRKLELQNQYLDAKQDVANKEVEIEQVKYQAMADITGALSGLLDAASEHSKGLAMASKVLALAEIAINTGKAIAAGVAQAQSVPFPGNIAAIATTITTILANITTATKTVKSAKFSHGGEVNGPGSGTSDSIPASLSNGESVMTALATSMFGPLLSGLNQMGGGVPINVASSNQTIGEEMLSRAFAKGAMMVPAPVLSVEEFNSVANRTKFVENIGDI